MMSPEVKWVDWRRAKTIDWLDRVYHFVLLVAVAPKFVRSNSVFDKHTDTRSSPRDRQRS